MDLLYSPLPGSAICVRKTSKSLENEFCIGKINKIYIVVLVTKRTKNDLTCLFTQLAALHDVRLFPEDIEDPCINVDEKKLFSYKINHLKSWLAYRGDTLRGIHTLRDAQLKVLSYCNGGTANNIIDPTVDKKWIKQKAKILNLKLILPKNATVKEICCPETFRTEVQNLNSADGWNKSLENLPNITIDKVQSYMNTVNKTYQFDATKLNKHFQRGKQLIEENFIDINSMFAKENGDYFAIKGVCAASLKKKDRWVFTLIKKSSGDIEFATCQCPAGKAGTCSHSYAILKIVAKWNIDKITTIPDQKACTSKPCVWSIPQSRGRVEKRNINEIEIISPLSKRSQTEIKQNSEKSGISSTLYPADAHIKSDDKNKECVLKLVSALKNTHSSLHFIEIANYNPQKVVETQ